MPRSIIVLSSDRDFFDSVRTLLGADERFIDVGDDIHCDGSEATLTNIYPVQMDPVEWDDWDTNATEMPDPRTMSALILECRSPEWVAEAGALLACGLEAPVWLVDAADSVWRADQVDPVRVVLA